MDNQKFDLPTKGRVLLKTNFGDVEVELWAKECPLACRSFLQHCVNQYYDGCQILRIVPGFCVQTGDPTNTGDGGESALPGKAPFKLETHPRIRFKHRGIVAMAGDSSSGNSSQFFITLDEARHLNDKHTAFGRVTPQTYFPILNMAKVQTDPRNDRPLEKSPPTIHTITVLENPFSDMVVTEDRGASKREDEEKEEAEAVQTKKKKRKIKATKNLAVLSAAFEEGDDEEAAVAGTVSTFVKGGRVASAHDLEADASFHRESVYTEQRKQEIKKAHREFDRAHGHTDSRTERLKRKVRGEQEEPGGTDDEDAPPPPDAPETSAESLAAIEQLRAEQAKAREDILRFKKKAGEDVSGPADDGPKTKGFKWLEEQRAKYARRRGGVGREKETVLKLTAFSAELKKTTETKQRQQAQLDKVKQQHRDKEQQQQLEKQRAAAAAEEAKKVLTEEERQEIDKPAHLKADWYEGAPVGADWMNNPVRFVNPEAKIAGALADDTYEVIDPLMQAGADQSQRAVAKRIRSSNHELEQQRRAVRVPDGFVPPGS